LIWCLLIVARVLWVCCPFVSASLARSLQLLHCKRLFMFHDSTSLVLHSCFGFLLMVLH
jgi:hypothetical protein